jgi:hypothetical protein
MAKSGGIYVAQPRDLPGGYRREFFYARDDAVIIVLSS